MGGAGGSWRLLLSLPRSSPSPSVPASLQTRRPTQPPLLGKLGRCMTQVTREHRSGARRLFKNSSPNVSDRREGSSGRGGSAAVLANDQRTGSVSLSVLDKTCLKPAEIIVVLWSLDDRTHPDSSNDNSEHHENCYNGTCVALPETKLVHDGNWRMSLRLSRKMNIDQT